MKVTLLLLLLVFSSSCAFVEKIRKKNIIRPSKKEFSFTDKSGSFLFIREKGIQKKEQSFVVKTQVMPLDGNVDKVLEQAISFSDIGVLKDKVVVLRPKLSQYTVWFDKKRYFTQLKTNIERKSIEVTMRSPEKDWNGTKEFPFPKGNGVFCYYNSLIDCVQVTGFMQKAIAKNAGQMSLTIIWDGYPYFQEQYENIPNQLFSRATLSYDSNDKNGEQRFVLDVANQLIYYSVTKTGDLKKQFWVSQGLSIKEKE